MKNFLGFVKIFVNIRNDPRTDALIKFFCNTLIINRGTNDDGERDSTHSNKDVIFLQNLIDYLNYLFCALQNSPLLLRV